MVETKLSKQQELIIRLLDWGTNSSLLPDDLFTDENRDELMSLNLIMRTGENEYSITQKATAIIETGGFIIKYPLADDKGNVSNYNDTLKNMSETALRALGLSIINTETVKRWGKMINVSLYKLIQSSLDYYRLKHLHPIARLEEYERDIDDTTTKYELVTNREFEEIKDFKLTAPILLYVNNAGIQQFVVSVADGKIVVNNNEDPSSKEEQYLYTIPARVKKQILKQFYTEKTRQ